MAISGLYGCNTQAKTENRGNPTTSSGATSQQPASSGLSLTEPSLTSEPDVDAKQKIEAEGGISSPQSTQNNNNASGGSTKSPKVSPNTIKLPPSITQPDSPAGVPAKVPNAASADPAPSSAPSASAQPAPPTQPVQPAPPAQPNASAAKALSDSSSGSPPAASPQAAQGINQPIDPDLQLPPSSSSTPQTTQQTSLSENTRSTGTGSASSNSRSNASGARQLEYKYNPSTGAYTTDPVE
ncbi:hypothetical protein [Acaryochloris sp. IP29b_bin.148]|uniref:hypothetical protein n=1 Tax=Acaryochloris sp. IP29b_bin.148 TaxID=2969218 RepID=UPI00261122BE|nr:hypothetical protein [Acaryochloris sp. IP29b_bin.148]